MISREDVWTDVRIGCSCYWCLQVFFERDKLRYDEISMSGVVQLRYMFRTGFMSQILSWCEKPGDHYSRWGWFSLPLSLDGMKSRFWMKITFHWSESQVNNPIANFLFVLLKGMTSQTIGLNIGFMPFLLKAVTSCVLRPSSCWGLGACGWFWPCSPMKRVKRSWRQTNLWNDGQLNQKKGTPGWFLNRLCA